MKKIAVLIPTFKPGFYLDECLQCLEAQTLSKDDFHVYIALNGPSEGYQDYVKTLVQQFTFQVSCSYIPEAGVSNARNFLIENSESEYVVFIDDDDLVSKNYLEMLLVASSERFMGISDVKNFESDISQVTVNYIGKCFHSIPVIETSKFLTRKYYSSPVAKMLHRIMISEYRFNVGLALGEDALFMAQLSNNIYGTVKVNDGAAYYVRQRIGSVSRRKIGKVSELKRICYLFYLYSKMLISCKYNVPFILSRMLATMLHLRRIFLFG